MKEKEFIFSLLNLFRPWQNKSEDVLSDLYRHIKTIKQDSDAYQTMRASGKIQSTEKANERGKDLDHLQEGDFIKILSGHFWGEYKFVGKLKWKMDMYCLIQIPSGERLNLSKNTILAASEGYTIIKKLEPEPGHYSSGMEDVAHEKESPVNERDHAETVLAELMTYMIKVHGPSVALDIFSQLRSNRTLPAISSPS